MALELQDRGAERRLCSGAFDREQEDTEVAQARDWKRQQELDEGKPPGAAHYPKDQQGQQQEAGAGGGSGG
eukprot:1039622-Heterocapsa_arctica.AAC.1